MTKISGLQDLIRIRFITNGEGVLSCGQFGHEITKMLERSTTLSVEHLMAFEDSDGSIPGRKVVGGKEIGSEIELCMEIAVLPEEESHSNLKSGQIETINGLVIRPLLSQEPTGEQAAIIVDCVDDFRKLFVAYHATYCPGNDLGDCRSYQVIHKEVRAT